MIAKAIVNYEVINSASDIDFMLEKSVSDPAWLDSNPDFLGADLPIKTHAELRFQRWPA